MAIIKLEMEDGGDAVSMHVEGSSVDLTFMLASLMKHYPAIQKITYDAVSFLVWMKKNKDKE